MTARTADVRSRSRYVARTQQKDGRGPRENEDSHAANTTLGRYAVSDGASTAARSEVWSTLLTHAFVREGRDPLRAETLAELRTRWWNAVTNTALPWFAQEKLARGSAATFLGLVLGPDRFHARAVGDSCLLHLRGGDIRTAGPLEASTQFTRTPPLVYTIQARSVEDAWACEGEYQPGDTFVLTTDAAAKYLLQQHEQRGTLPPLPRPGQPHSTFRRCVHELRAAGQLDNDDTTLCVIRT